MLNSCDSYAIETTLLKQHFNTFMNMNNANSYDRPFPNKDFDPFTLALKSLRDLELASVGYFRFSFELLSSFYSTDFLSFVQMYFNILDILKYIENKIQVVFYTSTILGCFCIV